MMNHSPQFNPHPDVESLSAFAENALPAHERTEMMAHITSCGRCRQIVFLSSEASQETPVEVIEPVLVSPSRRKQGLHQWQWIAGMGTAACAAALTVAFFLHNANIRPADNAAQLARNQAPQPDAHSALPTPAVEANQSPRVRTQQANQTIQSAQAAQSVQQLARRRAAETLPLPAPEPMAESASGTLEGTTNPSQQDVGGVSSQAGLPSSSPAIPARPASPADPATPTILPAAPAYSGSAASVTVNVSSAQIMAAPAPLPTLTQTIPERSLVAPGPVASKAASESKTHNASMGARALSTRTTSATATMAPPRETMRLEAVAGASPGLVQGRNEMHILLPGGATATSSALAEHRLLALDSRGRLYSSENSGLTWQNVSPQWTGHAMTVRTWAATKADSSYMQSFAAGSAASKPDASDKLKDGDSASSKKKTHAPVFELVNDAGAIWTSTDGKTWKAQ